MAATIGVYANAAMLTGRLRAHLPGVRLRALARRQGRLLAAGALAGATALALDQVLPTGGMGSLELLPALLAKVAAAAAVYLLAVRLLAREELDEGVRSVASLVARGGRGR
jgi:hypothetical protein